MIVHYVTGSRADFGLMEATLQRLAQTAGLEIGLVVTGQHLLEQYGRTERDIEASGLPIRHRTPVSLKGGSGAEMAYALADELRGFTQFWSENRPDLVLVLGDRGEMLAATLAAVHLGIHVAHLHGGELSGTLDESFRHAISKLSHFHLATSDDARQRLIRMGEDPRSIWTVGAPGLVGLTDHLARDRDFFKTEFGAAGDGPKALCIFHPVVQQAKDAGSQFERILDLLVRKKCTGLILRPNSDAGGAGIDEVIGTLIQSDASQQFTVRDHLERDLYLRCLTNADILVGNSSSGIIESASFGLPCLNIGQRQNGRLRNANVVDCATFEPTSLAAAFDDALTLKGPFKNLFGDGKTDERLAELLPKLPRTSAVLAKANAY